MNDFDAFKSVDFNWTVNLDQIWEDCDFDIGEINSKVRRTLDFHIQSLQSKDETRSPLGVVLVGEGGSGKSHLLRELRKEAAEKKLGFVAADLVGVRDFWDTVLLAYLNSLQQPYQDNIPQYQLIIDHLIHLVDSSSQERHLADRLADFDNEKTIKAIQTLLNKLNRSYRQQINLYHDVIRALILFNSNDFEVQNIGFSWLQGLGIEDADTRKYKFSAPQKDSIEIVKALSWLMNLRSPTILVLDQMDSIVHQYHLASGTGTQEHLDDKQLRARSIIHEVAGGLANLVDNVTYRTLVVVSCVEATWNILDSTLATNRGRFHLPPLPLEPIHTSHQGQKLIEERLQKTYQKKQYKPPYPSWPFKPTAFESESGLFPRQLLRKCEQHKQKCMRDGQITELDQFDKRPNGDNDGTNQQSLQIIDEQFRQLKKEVFVDNWLEENPDDKEDLFFGKLLQTVCECLIVENPLPDTIDPEIKVDFPKTKKFPPLHVRLRLIFRSEGDKEKNLSFRALFRNDARAFQNRLNAAMTISGIDTDLPFRKLAIVTQDRERTGNKTKQLINKFQQAGGWFTIPSEDDLRVMAALSKHNQKPPEQWEGWLKERKPASNLGFLKEMIEWLFDSATVEREKSVEIPHEPQVDEQASKQYKKESKAPPNSLIKENDNLNLHIGSTLAGSNIGEPIYLDSKLLSSHIAALAGSGSGKTVLLKRIVEEAARKGIPSIVLDGANDMASIGEKRSNIPEEWSENEIKQAEHYHEQSEVMIWTPGIENGNPFHLDPLPNFQEIDLQDDSSELQSAIDMAVGSLKNIVATGQSGTAQVKEGILASALQYFAQQNGRNLEGFVELLTDLPPDARMGVSKEEKHARDMADQLRAKMKTDALFRPSGEAFDPSRLFGLNESSNKTRISVINLLGLPHLEMQQQFLNQLAMVLFTWIRKNPAPTSMPLRGLLVIDEAKDFVPSLRSTPCKASLIRLVAQARKYGLGLIFATQEPKSIEHTITSNCTTQFYGKANSIASESAIQDLMRSRGGGGHDIARLSRGCFYYYTEGLKAPTKVQVSPCYSDHREPLKEETILEMAKASRKVKY